MPSYDVRTRWRVQSVAVVRTCKVPHERAGLSDRDGGELALTLVCGHTVTRKMRAASGTGAHPHDYDTPRIVICETCQDLARTAQFLPRARRAS